MDLKKLIKKAKTQRQKKIVDSILFTASQFDILAKKNLSIPIRLYNL